MFLLPHNSKKKKKPRVQSGNSNYYSLFMEELCLKYVIQSESHFLSKFAGLPICMQII